LQIFLSTLRVRPKLYLLVNKLTLNHNTNPNTEHPNTNPNSNPNPNPNQP